MVCYKTATFNPLTLKTAFYIIGYGFKNERKGGRIMIKIRRKPAYLAASTLFTPPVCSK